MINIEFIIIIYFFLIFLYIKMWYQNKEYFDNNIRGIVLDGEKVASNIYDYPTANISVKHNYNPGVYSADSNFGKCICFIPSKYSLECHIKDFNKDIYGKELVLNNLKENNDNLSKVIKAGYEKYSDILM